MSHASASPEPLNEMQAARRHWMGVLARADSDALDAAMLGAGIGQSGVALRGPEIGLVMVRGRMGGEGQPFNVGEMTVTRCSMRLDNGQIGHSMVSGRRPGHARNSALIDAMMQDETRRAALHAAIIAPLAAMEREQRDAAMRETAATRVDFFTLVRGEDGE